MVDISSNVCKAIGFTIPKFRIVVGGILLRIWVLYDSFTNIIYHARRKWLKGGDISMSEINALLNLKKQNIQHTIIIQS